MGRRRKPTNRQLTQGIIDLNKKVDTMCGMTQSLLRDFIGFMDKDEDFQTYLEKKYAVTEQNKDSKESE